MGNQLNTKQMFSKIVAVLSLAVVATQAVEVDKMDVKSIKKAVHSYAKRYHAKKMFHKRVMRHLRRHSTKKCGPKCVAGHLMDYKKLEPEAQGAIKALIHHGRGKLRHFRNHVFRKARKANRRAWKKVSKLRRRVDRCMRSSKCWRWHMNRNKHGRACLKHKRCTSIATYMMKNAWIRRALQRCWWSRRHCALGF